MTAKEELIEKILNYDKKFVICTNPEIAKLFREKLEEYNISLN